MTKTRKPTYRIKEVNRTLNGEHGNHWFVVLGPGAGIYRFAVWTRTMSSALVIKAKAIAGEEITSADFRA